ncbi:MAG: hypothetical protein NVS4B3_15390 [Gemmatimonadaceae bacterium]
MAVPVLPLVMLAAVACASPEARRGRDGGPGADPGNKTLADVAMGKPMPDDTTLWPGKAAAPTDRLAAGTMPLPASALPAPATAPAAATTTAGQTPAGASAQVVRPVTPSTSDTRSFDKGKSANPRTPSAPKP